MGSACAGGTLDKGCRLLCQRRYRHGGCLERASGRLYGETDSGGACQGSAWDHNGLGKRHHQLALGEDHLWNRAEHAGSVQLPGSLEAGQLDGVCRVPQEVRRGLYFPYLRRQGSADLRSIRRRRMCGSSGRIFHTSVLPRIQVRVRQVNLSRRRYRGRRTSVLKAGNL